jgi:hypothetical protein
LSPTYLGKIVAGRIDLRVENEWLQFAVFDASASAYDAALTVIAVEVRQLEASQPANRSQPRKTRYE